MKELQRPKLFQAADQHHHTDKNCRKDFPCLPGKCTVRNIKSLDFFASGVGFTLYTEIVYIITQWSNSASESLWEMPNTKPGTSAPKGWCATNEPPHLHPWTTASPTMSHHISNNEPPHLQQWATKSPTISHHISNNNPLHLQQWATTSPQWATTSPEKLNRWMFNAGGGGSRKINASIHWKNSKEMVTFRIPSPLR